MTISFLTECNTLNDKMGLNFFPPSMLQSQKQHDFYDRNCISKTEFSTLPADKKAGFLLLQDKGFYIPKWSPSDSRREAAHRLVEASKSPTRENDAIELAISKHKFLKNINAPELVQFNIDYSTGEYLPHNTAVEFEPQKQITPHGTAGTSTIVQFRDWSQEWRIRTETQGANINPPSQVGERISELLSERGAKKIAESCEYMTLKKGGYKTFATATFAPEIRELITQGKTTIQREVSRCMDAIQKIYQRGWVTPDGEKVNGHSEGLCYCWVVEIPKNQSGTDNPHVHLLMGWRVPYRLFDAWSKRLESVWGNGTFHLEKIKDCACAGAYMAKAAGYLSKAAGDDSQGQVRGNRYGISDPARAPAWVTIGKAQLHSMGQIIADVYDHLTVKYGADYRERKQLKTKLDSLPKDKTALRQRIGEQLQKVREKLNALPIRCNKYQVILKGQTVAGLFLTWAQGERVSRPDWLPELPQELSWQPGKEPEARDSLYWSKWREMRKKFQLIKQRRHAFTDSMCIALVEQCQEFRAEALSEWESWASSGFSQ